MSNDDASRAAPPSRAKSYGTRNAYKCEACGGLIITQDIEEGVTPFLLPCVATSGCMGMMKSACYRGPLGGPDAIPLRPHYVWRKPTPKEYAKLSKQMKHHVDQGGLDIYPLDPIDVNTVPPRPL